MFAGLIRGKNGRFLSKEESAKIRALEIETENKIEEEVKMNEITAVEESILDEVTPVVEETASVVEEKDVVSVEGLQFEFVDHAIRGKVSFSVKSNVVRLSNDLQNAEVRDQAIFEAQTIREKYSDLVSNARDREPGMAVKLWAKELAKAAIKLQKGEDFQFVIL